MHIHTYLTQFQSSVRDTNRVISCLPASTISTNSDGKEIFGQVWGSRAGALDGGELSNGCLWPVKVVIELVYTLLYSSADPHCAREGHGAEERSSSDPPKYDEHGVLSCIIIGASLSEPHCGVECRRKSLFYYYYYYYYYYYMYRWYVRFGPRGRFRLGHSPKHKTSIYAPSRVSSPV